MTKNKFTPLTAREIKPEGWLREQLQIQANGLHGHLDSMWRDIRDSAWIGGSRDSWERFPYWLDGFIPLAYLLRDDEMIARADKYVETILEKQQADGWLCPCAEKERENYDVWAVFLICKVLALYADCAGKEETVLPALEKALKCLDKHLDMRTLYNWGAARWFECLVPILWVYERTKEEWLLDLAQKLRVFGADYDALFEDFRMKTPERRWTYLTHVVNLAMSLKQGALWAKISGGDPEKYAERALACLEKYHGMAMGHFTGDECLSGDSPVQGTELCGVVEAMYSYETLLSVSGGVQWGDRLERLAFNGLAATISEDMWTHQYLQMTNQPQCSVLPKDNIVFRTNNEEAHLFGLEPHFGCCTANFGQGWPKLALSSFQKSESGLVSAVLVPSSVETEIGGTRVTCKLETEYPFRGDLKYTVTTEKPAEFELAVRIPGFAKSASANGEAIKTGAFYKTKRVWEGTQEIHIHLNFECVLTDRPRELKCLWRGPLLFSVPIKTRRVMHEYTRDGVERKFPYCDYELFPESKWNYGFAGDTFEAIEHERKENTVPFSESAPTVTIKTKLKPVDWAFENGVCAVEPGREAISDAEEIELIPYGCAKLRMTELPVIK